MSTPAEMQDQIERLRLMSRGPDRFPFATRSKSDGSGSDVFWRTVPTEFRSARIGDLTPGAVHTELSRWANTPTDTRLPNVMIAGPVGVGKTYAACAASRRLVDRGWPFAFLSVKSMFAGRYERDIADRAATVGLLLLDDLGSERGSDFTDERLLWLIDERWSNGRPVIATTNVALDQFDRVVGERVLSRLIGAGSVVLRMSGPDRRRNHDVGNVSDGTTRGALL